MKSRRINGSLCLFTSEFPYGNSETYIESEIPVLSSIFDKIYIFPAKSKGKTSRTLPENFEVVIVNDDWTTYKNKLLFNNLFFVTKTLWNEFLFTSEKKIFLRDLRLFKNMLLNKIHVAEQLKDIISEKNISGSVFCSYWFSNWVISLGILKKEKVIGSFVSRAHGFDIYDDRYSDSIIPFRCFQLKQVDKVYSVSEKGANYLKSKNYFPEKISTSYLGVHNAAINPFENNLVFTLVSCSNVNIYKRVDLIIEILKYINFPLKWVHFGDGAMLEEMKTKSGELKNNIKVEFRGRVSNKEILDFYATNMVNLFITTSAVEGLPMTLIEACSFGIPLMGTDVGGIPEIINEKTGLLIPEKVDAEAVAKMIIAFREGAGNTETHRKAIKKYWEENFEANKNYTEFYSNLIKMNATAGD